MNLPSQRGLEAFRAFVESGSVSLAAQRLGRTQPQVGRLLTALEEEVGFRLFGRDSRPLTLTAEGRQFYAQVERVLMGYDGLDHYAAQLRRPGKEHVRILTAPFMAHSLVGDAVAKVAARSKNFSASIEARVRLDIETWVGQESFDLGISIMPLSHSAFVTEDFLRVDAMVAMRPDHPLARLDVVTFEDYVTTDVIATHPRSIIRQHLERLCRESGKTLKIRFEATNGVIACQLAERGLGCCLSDPFVARSSGTRDLILRPFVPCFPLIYGFIYPVWQTRSRAVIELVNEIRISANAEADTFL